VSPILVGWPSAAGLDAAVPRSRLDDAKTVRQQSAGCWTALGLIIYFVFRNVIESRTGNRRLCWCAVVVLFFFK